MDVAAVRKAAWSSACAPSSSGGSDELSDCVVKLIARRDGEQGDSSGPSCGRTRAVCGATTSGFRAVDVPLPAWTRLSPLSRRTQPDDRPIDLRGISVPPRSLVVRLGPILRPWLTALKAPRSARIGRARMKRAERALATIARDVFGASSSTPSLPPVPSLFSSRVAWQAYRAPDQPATGANFDAFWIAATPFHPLAPPSIAAIEAVATSKSAFSWSPRKRRRLDVVIGRLGIAEARDAPLSGRGTFSAVYRAL